MGVETIVELGQYGVWGIIVIAIYFLAKSEIYIKYPRTSKPPAAPDEGDK